MHSLKNVDILFCVCHLIQDSFLCSQYGGLVNNWAGSQNVLFRLDGTQHLLQKKSFLFTSDELQDNTIQKVSKHHCLETEGRHGDFEDH